MAKRAKRAKRAKMRCVQAQGSSTTTTKRRERVAKPKGSKTMTIKRKRAAASNDVPAPPDQVAYSRALKQGKTRDEAMAIARKRGAEVVAAKAAAYERAAAYRR